MSIPLRVAVLSFMLGLPACADRAPRQTDTAVIWTLSPPRVSIGVADGDERYMFGRVVGAQLLDDGSTIVGDARVALTIYDSAGVFVRRFGRKGSGPGEFALMWGPPFAYRGDSVAVWDIVSSRVSVFDASGNFGRTATVTVPRRYWPPGTVPDQSCCHMGRAFPDGSFMLEYPAAIPNEPGPHRFSTKTLARLTSDGTGGDTVGTFASMRYRYDPTGGSSVQGIRLASRFSYALMGDTLFGGNGEGPWLLRLTPGKGVDTVRLDDTPRPVTQAIKDAYADAYRAEFKRNPRIFEGPPEELFEGEYVENLPAFVRVLSDGAGHLWLQQWQLPFSGESTRYHVYSTSGRAVARVAIPGRILDIRGSRVALLSVDSLGVESVRIHEIKAAR
jgi:hypothetical protein